MILSRLKLENFKRYSSYEIEFGEGLIGIIGKNGSGKSTIFEAIFFALYGELKGKGYKDIVKNSVKILTDSKFRKKIGDNAQKLIKNEYSFERGVEGLNQIYENITKK